ncbi:hypothetical protein BMT55_14810 [Listeria newyorkensis]|uniref:SGNH hydrolase-type esterase domain-containing protein n=1 Tax=Listeria newyorkensis TaxID=1497681 RepID=A0ABX4XPZ1_9LIST|nr:SGNH/GDSL hydrolase family protein [Listeria newyorkensis]KGL46808.1 hypothetical protein EP58_00285 [Listeria newyorkensis]KMT62994.1 phage pre-neck appendage-like protein [Listeria newyorkensis]PNP88463.1 hypothetical protein BMT55_14810 [Listeria newyorkensis]WAO20546.1 SGNH/GDSL hydrolase family protein [Listeria newyorkensis]SQC56739.1 Uncharacterised protein [Listeria newyorkensis]
MTIKLNRPTNALQGGSYRNALNQNWDMLEKWMAENGIKELSDFLANTSTIGGGRHDTTFDTNTSLGALRAIIEYIRMNYPGTEIYLFTPLQNATRDMDKHEVITNGIIAIADIYSLPRLDLFRMSGLGKYTYELYTRDGLHPNNEGFHMIGKRIVRMMESS